MRILQAVRRHKQALMALMALIIVGAVALIFFASEGWASGPDSRVELKAEPTVYIEKRTPKITNTTTTTTTTTTAPKPTTPVATTAKPIVPAMGDEIYLKLAQCESGDPTYNGSSGYDGAFQFLPSTWNSMNTGYAFAYQAPFDVQLDAAKRLIARSGWGQFPACARKLGML